MNVVKPNQYGKLDSDHLAVFEKKMGVRLPEDYRKYLREFNGGKWSNKIFRISEEEGSSSIHHVFGIHDGPSYSRLDAVVERTKGIIGDGYLPIADDDGGNKICIGIHGENYGKIYFWDHETYFVLMMALTFDEFVDSLSDVLINTSEIEAILEADDVTKMHELVSAGYDFESLDDQGRSLIERAAIKAKPKIIEYLAHEGASLRNSLALAKRNAEYFDEHKPIVELISKLKK